MTTPTGTISMYNVAQELGIAAAGINLNMGSVRALAGQPSGAVTLNNLRGKSNLPPVSVSVANVSATRMTNNTGTATVQATVNASGGSGGFTYSCTYLSGSSFSITGANLSTPGFQGTVSPGALLTGMYRALVTDSGGRSAYYDFRVTLNGYPV